MTTLLPEPVLAPADNRLTLTLSEQERREVALLATQLAYTAPRLIDDPVWVEAARELSCRLPHRLQEVIRAYRHDPGEDGILALRNLPVVEEELPFTPAVPDSVEREAAVPAAIAALVALNLGEIVAYHEEKFGALVQNVVPVPGRETSQSNAGSVPLELHVENAFHPHRPDFVGLLCLRNDRTRTAGTLVTSVRNTLGLLPEHVVEVLGQPRFRTAPPPSFGSGDSGPVHPVFSGSPADPNVRVDFHATEALDEEAGSALTALRDAFLRTARTLVLQQGEMAFVDNRVTLHGRTAFEPSYDGFDRWLHRTFVNLDNRRTRGRRPGNGSVLV
ncbi:TauD/TfdA family dioxygenase [Kitasatospora sp. NPDC058063]|uniref:TauD/TfdA family dioxygenase n=1 Tax=unclassified Kitasatospora TaxID=2633591 RepID=UPI0036D9E8A7